MMPIADYSKILLLVMVWFRVGCFASDQKHLITTHSFPSGTLIANGSFENNYGDYSFEGWSDAYPPFASQVARLLVLKPLPSEDITKPYNGRRMAALEFNAPSSQSKYLVSDLFALKPDTWYTFFLKYKTQGYDPVTPLQRVHPVFNAFKSRDWQSPGEEDGVSGEYGPAYQKADQWVTYIHRFKTMDQANFGTVSLLWGAAQNAHGNFFMDDAYLVQGCVRGVEGEVLPAGCPTNDNVAFGGDARHPDFIGVSRKFLDGNNKVVQTGVEDGSRDIVQQSFYDNLGRVRKLTLPIGFNFQSNAHDFIPDIKADFTQGDMLGNFYNRADAETTPNDPKEFNTWLDDDILDRGLVPYPEADGTAFAEFTYESSPLGRNTENAGAGANWKTGSEHTSKITYSSVPDLQNYATLPSPVSENGIYFVQETKDVQGKLKRVFTDQLGNIVRTSSKLANKWINTDYRYDANGNVIAKTAPAGQGTEHLTRFMGFDAMNKLINESNPETGVSTFLADDLGRRRFSQSQNQFFSHSFSFTKYDDLGRVTEEGEISDLNFFTQDFASLSEFPCISECEKPEALIGASLVRFRNLNHYDTDFDQMSCSGGAHSENGTDDMVFVAKDIGGTTSVSCSDELSLAYSGAVSAVGTQIGESEILALFDSDGELTVTPPAGTEIDFQTGPHSFSLTAVNRTTTEGAEGMDLYNACGANKKTQRQALLGSGDYLYGRLAKTMACNSEVATVLADEGSKEVSQSYNYDKFGNVIAKLETNEYVSDARLQLHLSVNTFDPSNRLIRRTSCSGTDCDAAWSHIEEYRYDQLGRTSKVMDKNEAVLLENHFNRIGQLSYQGLGTGLSNTAANGLVREIKYNLQGAANDTKASKVAGNTLLFRESLLFEEGFVPRYDNSISEAIFNFPTLDPAIRNLRYIYGYDDLNRLKYATAQPSSYGTSTEYDYLDDGRISHMMRGFREGDYSYDFQGRLKEIDGNLIDGRPMGLKGNGNPVFSYDGNGNLIMDESKPKDAGPLEIHYRPDNLPYLLVYTLPGIQTGTFDEYQVYMVYDGAGNRVSKILHKNDTFREEKNYFSGKEIRKDGAGLSEHYALASIGRLNYSASFPLGSVEFHLTDHLGGTREVYDFNSGSITYATHYDPYGKKFGEYRNIRHDVTNQFTGKEQDKDYDLTYFGARYYDQDIGLWISPDPVRQFHSPYLYTGNGYNPINGTDPSGMLFGQGGASWGDVQNFIKHPVSSVVADMVYDHSIAAMAGLMRDERGDATAPGEGNRYDAFRHIYGAILLYRALEGDLDLTLELLSGHEVGADGQNSESFLQDIHNNAEGLKAAMNPGNAEIPTDELARQVLKSGSAQTSRKDAGRGAEEYKAPKKD